jgi:hypothetical protein
MLLTKLRCTKQVAVVLKSNELLDHVKRVLEESRQATEVQLYCSSVPQNFINAERFSIQQLALGATACWAESHFLFTPGPRNRCDPNQTPISLI